MIILPSRSRDRKQYTVSSSLSDSGEESLADNTL